MGVFRDNARGTWTVQCWYRDWQGARRKKTKRGFKSRASALAWERDFALRSAGAIDMRFGDFYKLYEEDVKPQLKLNTWLSKEHMFKTKILPFFEDKPVNVSVNIVFANSAKMLSPYPPMQFLQPRQSTFTTSG